MIEKVLDEYELKARVAPGLILAFPVLADVLYATPSLSSWPTFATGGICSLALVYGLGHLVRARGKAIEVDLWRDWDGPPSTRFMRQRDPLFSPELKASIRDTLAERFAAKLLTPSEEAKDPASADKSTADAFRQVRQSLRRHDSGGLWFKNNIDYGFCRNLFGCRWAWATVALLAAAFAAIDGIRTGRGFMNIASAIGCFSFLASLYVGWVVLPRATKTTADSYAELAWIAFLQTK
jgi:hypothetical protein